MKHCGHRDFGPTLSAVERFCRIASDLRREAPEVARPAEPNFPSPDPLCLAVQNESLRFSALQVPMTTRTITVHRALRVEDWRQ
jgi:hypothetical protein